MTILPLWVFCAMLSPAVDAWTWGLITPPPPPAYHSPGRQTPTPTPPRNLVSAPFSVAPATEPGDDMFAAKNSAFSAIGRNSQCAPRTSKLKQLPLLGTDLTSRNPSTVNTCMRACSADSSCKGIGVSVPPSTGGSSSAASWSVKSSWVRPGGAALIKGADGRATHVNVGNLLSSGKLHL